MQDDELRSKIRSFKQNIPELKSELDNNEKTRKKFVERFPASSLSKMTKETYSIGRGDNNSFCYWVERETASLGSILGARADKFGLWYSEGEKRYKATERYGGNPERAITEIRENLLSLVEMGASHNLASISRIELSPMFKGKVLYLYYPELYLNIFSESVVVYFLKVLDIPIGNRRTVEEKRDSILKWKNTNSIMVAEGANEWSSDMLTHFLYSQFKDEYAVIMKLSFSDDSGLEPDTYLEELANGVWNDRGWGTPGNYMNGGMEAGGRRKLLLFDTDDNVRGITAEFEVDRVQKGTGSFPYRNMISEGSFKKFNPPIPVSDIETVPGLGSINRFRGHFVLSTYQYFELTGSSVGHVEDEAYPQSSDQADAELGRMGEEFVVKCEQEKLRRSGKPDLAAKVEGVGERMHYDVKSYDSSGIEKIIEVKTTVGSWDSVFYITHSELDQLRKYTTKYLLYRVYEFDRIRRTGKIMVYDSDALDLFDFKPITFKTSPKRKGAEYEA